MEVFEHEKALSFTEKLMDPTSDVDGYSTNIMGVLKPELLEFGERFDRLRYPVQSWQRNTRRGLQGGMLAAMIDNSIGITLIPRWGPVTSVSLDINYLAPIGSDVEEVEIVTSAEKIGASIIYTHSEVFLPDGRKAADAVSNLMRLR